MSLITVFSEGYWSLHCFMEFAVSLFEFFGSLVFVSLLLLSFYLWTVFILCFRLSNVCVPLSLRDVRWGQCPACVGWNKDTWWKKGTSQECTGGDDLCSSVSVHQGELCDPLSPAVFQFSALCFTHTLFAWFLYGGAGLLPLKLHTHTEYITDILIFKDLFNISHWASIKTHFIIHQNSHSLRNWALFTLCSFTAVTMGLIHVIPAVQSGISFWAVTMETWVWPGVCI